MFLIDTSVLITAFSKELQTSAAQSWLGKHKQEPLFISDWTSTEFASAMNQKVRTKVMTHTEYIAAKTLFQRVRAQSLQVAAVERNHFFLAAELCEKSPTSLRASDALHLAMAIDFGATLVTRDKQLAVSATHFDGHTIRLP